MKTTLDLDLVTSAQAHLCICQVKEATARATLTLNTISPQQAQAAAFAFAAWTSRFNTSTQICVGAPELLADDRNKFTYRLDVECCHDSDVPRALQSLHAAAQKLGCFAISYPEEKLYEVPNLA